MADAFDFVIIGAGPSGESAAFEARQRGASVAIVDVAGSGSAADRCIPSKSS
jgi:pyruvate/2-oxoglutarate dehydrogenase complex dihydrolipoamide dehydrogenase (E3) component